MRRGAFIASLFCGILLSLGKNPSHFIVCFIALMVIYGWLRNLIGKEGFNSDFWLSLIIVIVLPVILCSLISAIGWPWIIATLVILSLILLRIDRQRNRNHPINSPRGAERTPLYPMNYLERHDRGEWE